MADDLQTNNTPTPEQDPTAASPIVRDRRKLPEGVVPKQAQGYVVAGLAVLILMAVMFSKNHAKPAAKTAESGSTAVSTDINQRKIQELEQDLSADQRQSQERTAAQAVGTVASPTGAATPTNSTQPGASAQFAQMPPAVVAQPPEPPRDPVEDAEKALAFKARFASNLVAPDDGATRPSVEKTAGTTADNTNTASRPVSLPSTSSSQSAATTSTDKKRAPEVNVNAAHGQPFVVFEGTTIDTVLVNRLDGEFAGPLKVMVTNPVYSQDRQHLLVPEGTFILGDVQKVGGLGQKRLAVTFHRMLMPDGYSVDLDQFHGLDQAGATGLKDKVNNRAHPLFSSIAVCAKVRCPELCVRYLSVCSGIEAVSVAWHPLGWQPAMFAEIDPFCCWLLRSRYRASRPIFMPSPHDAPDRREARRRAAAIRNVVALPADGDVINAGDFTKIGKDDVGAIDLLAGGTPCQSFSIAGKRAGLDDPRGNLTIEFARLADRLRPTWLVWENVPGVLSIDGGRTFGAFLGMLVECGYGVAYRVLDAQYFGVPQRRRRVFVVGHSGGWRGPAAVLLEFASLSGYPPPRREARQRAAGGVEVGPAGGRLTDTAPTIDAGCKDGFVRNQLGVGVISSTDEISHCLNAGGMGRQDFETETLIAHSLSADGFDASEDGTGRGTPMVPVAICTAHTQSNGSGFSDGIAHTLESAPGTQAVAFNLRGREGGAMPETSDAASLRASSGGSTNSYIAFSAKDHGADADHIAPTLRGMEHDGSHPNGGGQIAIAFSTNQRGEARERDVHGSLSSSRGGGNQLDGVLQARIEECPAPVAFTLHGSDKTASAASSTEIAGSLRTRAPGGIENSSTTAVVQEQSIASPLTASYGKQIDSSDTSSGPPNLLRSQMAVRRLTPRECERLQGFPDDYTLVEYRGKPASDGPRYKALGNSMAVPVMRWIGQRIAAVDAILREHDARREP